ncbi:inositol monophosphatase [Rhodococcus sp. HNM0569]|nr:inositol monophosphatase family protein [Rhodococcus sp. HNM0569]NLU81377.1 inositol monophosphatase [Rhodococcus sp. HNM0569]
MRRVAVDVALEAAELVRSTRPALFGRSGTARAEAGSVAAKSTATDPVTVVDTESERLIRTLLARLRPGDAILGEEGGEQAGADADGVRWVVDPIDGTVNFLYGLPAYAVSIAAQIGGRSVAGAVVDVAAGDVYSAAAGGGATVADPSGDVSTLRCNRVTDLSMALVATGFAYSATRRRAQGELVAALLPRVRDIRRVGSAALDLCMVAAGRVDAHYEHGLSPWDWAAGALVAAEAGAVLVLPDAESTGADGRLTVAAAPGIADEMARVFAELGVDRALPEGASRA